MKPQHAAMKSLDEETLPVVESFGQPKYSVIVSLYNNADEAGELIRSLLDAFAAIRKSFEIVLVDDGSDDGTPEIVESIVGENQQLKLIRMRSRFGEASAFNVGLTQTTGDIVVYLTSRVRVNPKNLLRLIEKLEQGKDLVVGWRHPRRDSKLNRIISRIFNAITCRLAKINLHDINSGVLATRREVLEHIDIYGDMNNFIPILARRQGYKIAEEKIEQLPGKFRKSKYLREYLQRLLDILTVVFLTNYSKKPIHFLGFVGAVFTLLGAGIEFYLFVYRILALGPIAGRPLLLLGALLLVIGIQLISIGLLGEMIIFTHARDIKEYNIEEIIESKRE
ncbi:MAG: glycosyltransferase [Calditrichaeota bacterium]|nr:glycosyltransferase [Calditrichota bacterium]